MNPQNINNIYGYIRVSVAKYKSENAEDRKREEENRISIIEQETKIKEYAQKMGKEVKQFFTDYGKSAGRNKKREQLAKMLSVVDENDVIACADISRLSRSIVDFNLMLELAQEKKFCFYFVVNDIYSNSTNGKLFLNMLSFVAETERSMVQNRCKRAWDIRKQKMKEKMELEGKKDNGLSQKCWINLDENKKLKQIITKLLKEGLSYNEVAKELNFHEHKTHQGKEFYASTIKDIIHHLDIKQTLCPCGSIYLEGRKTKHIKGNKHKMYLMKLKEEKRKKELEEEKAKLVESTIKQITN